MARHGLRILKANAQGGARTVDIGSFSLKRFADEKRVKGPYR